VADPIRDNQTETSETEADAAQERSRADFLFSGEDPSGRTRDPDDDRRRGLIWLAAIVAAVLVAQLLWPGTLVAFVVIMAILIPMVIFHEWGHFITARRFGVAVPEFFVGFGPRLWSFRKGRTEYGIKALFPAGGYVRISGMSQYEPVQPEDRGHTFRDVARWKRAIVLSAGSATHFFTALVLLFVLLAFVGMPRTDVPIPPVVGSVESASAAATAGLQPGDRVTAIDGQPISDWSEVPQYLQGLTPGAPVTIGYERGGSAGSVSATLGSKTLPDGRTVGFLGVGPERPDVEYETVPVLQAIPQSFVMFGRIVSTNVGAITKTFSASNLKCLGQQMTGGECQTDYRPSSVVGVANAAKQSLLTDPVTLLFLIITLNIFVGMFNLLPLLPLDGGHLAVLGVEAVASKVRRRPVEIDQRHLIPITVGVMSLLMLLFVSSLYLDIANPLKLP